MPRRSAVHVLQNRIRVFLKCPNVMKKLTPAKFKHQLVLKTQWVALVDSACRIRQAQHAMREVGRQTRDSTIQCIATAWVASCIHRFKAS